MHIGFWKEPQEKRYYQEDIDVREMILKQIVEKQNRMSLIEVIGSG
jgi:hypothetical protein